MTNQNIYLKHILPLSPNQPMVCHYCKGKAHFHEGLWRCNPCNALAKANKENQKPLGIMANQSLWNLRKFIHKQFGSLMQDHINNGLSKTQARKAVVTNINAEIYIPLKQFNIDCFDEYLCNIVSEILTRLKTSITPICPYCSKPSVFIRTKRIYRCDPCDAQVGTHKHNNKPLGTLANATLREARKQAHAYFDPLWTYKIKRDSISTSKARKSAYLWLSNKMGIEFEKCHIGEFNIEQCELVVSLCKPYISNAMKQLKQT